MTKIIECLNKTVTVRPGPEATGFIAELPPGHTLMVEDTIYLDKTHQNNDNYTWWKIAEGEYKGFYVNRTYPTSTEAYKERYREVDERELEKVVIVKHFTNGTTETRTVGPLD